MTLAPLPPGSTIGIIGSGQLGRMAALAAARLGYRVHVYSPEKDSPAEQVSAAATVASYTDTEALAAFARAVDVVTFEFENIPADSVKLLAGLVPVRPSWRVLEVAQDRI
ncbi:MAG: NAD(P)-dependent oxidoreductase, partial [Pseudomonadota bacterium]